MTDQTIHIGRLHTSQLIRLEKKLNRGFRHLALVVHCTTEFGSNPNQTHLNKQSKAFRFSKKLQAVELDQGWR